MYLYTFEYRSDKHTEIKQILSTLKDGDTVRRTYFSSEWKCIKQVHLPTAPIGVYIMELVFPEGVV